LRPLGDIACQPSTPSSLIRSGLDYKPDADWLATWPLQNGIRSIAAADVGDEEPRMTTERRRKVSHHRDVGGLIKLHIAQAFRQAVLNGRGDASGAIWWQRRCQLDQDVREDIPPHCDRVKIA